MTDGQLVAALETLADLAGWTEGPTRQRALAGVAAALRGMAGDFACFERTELTARTETSGASQLLHPC